MNRLIADRFGVLAMRTDQLYPWQVRPVWGGGDVTAGLPPGAREHLRLDNPRLLELEKRYAAVDPRATRPLVWVPNWFTNERLPFFRGDNQYVWQRRGLNQSELAYALTYFYTKSAPEGRFLEKLDEDDLFGIHAFSLDGRQVSRDLLDSAREIEFLQSHIPARNGKLRVLDIGAGYGRLAYRLTQALPKVEVFATDGYATSTFLAEYYLGFRNCTRARALPLDEVETFVSSGGIDVAVNVHSFSECTSDAIRWWMEQLVRGEVPYLMVVPNTHGRCANNEGYDMEEIFAEFGYRRTLREPRYREPAVQQFGVDPIDFYLFARD